MDMTFLEWMPGYVEFRQKCHAILSKPLSSEPSELQHESQNLEPLRYEAERMRASAMSHYYAAKIFNIEKLREEGWAMSAVCEVAKAKSNKELWASEDAQGLNEAIKSRQIKISVLSPRKDYRP
jgi:hypothetical protein